MRILPRSTPDRVEFFQTHLEAWSADPAALGLSPEQVAALDADVTAARAALAAAASAREAAAAATGTAHRSAAAMLRRGRAMIATIKAFAAASADPGILAAARLPLPDPPSPLPAPGSCEITRLTLDAECRPTLVWRGRAGGGERGGEHGMAGVVYLVERWGAHESGWGLAGAVAAPAFTDAPLPVGATRYRVRAQRGARAGEWSYPAEVRVGVAGAALARRAA